MKTRKCAFQNKLFLKNGIFVLKCYKLKKKKKNRNFEHIASISLLNFIDDLSAITRS